MGRNKFLGVGCQRLVWWRGMKWKKNSSCLFSFLLLILTFVLVAGEKKESVEGDKKGWKNEVKEKVIEASWGVWGNCSCILVLGNPSFLCAYQFHKINGFVCYFVVIIVLVLGLCVTLQLWYF